MRRVDLMDFRTNVMRSHLRLPKTERDFLVLVVIYPQRRYLATHSDPKLQ